MKRIMDNNSEYVQCENSNLRFHGTKLDRNGNECAVFSTPNHNAFSIQRNSLWGTQSWNTGSKSTMDAETFLEKNPKVTLESLERDVIKLANQTKAAWGKNVRVHNKQILDSKIKDDDSSQKGLIEDFSLWASDECCPLTPYHFKGFKENDPSFNSNAAFDIIDELVKWNGFILEDLNDLVVAKFDNHDNAAVEDCCEDIKFRVGNALSRVDRYFDDKIYIVQLYIKALERAHRLAVNELKSLNTVSDSKKIKDANDTPDVLDGVLFVAFEDGTEDEMIAEVNKHKNESGKIDGVQYETYETDSQDGVAMIDLCAMTGDANGFVKALLNEWGVAENVIDLEFQASDEMKEAVNDSQKVKDSYVDVIESPYLAKLNSRIRNFDKPNAESVREIAEKYIGKYVGDFYDELNEYFIDSSFGFWEDRNGKRTIESPEVRIEYKFNNEGIIEDIISVTDKSNQVNDSRVNDMTKPVHLRGYAEKVRANRRKKNDEQDDEKETEKQDVADSRNRFDFQGGNQHKDAYISELTWHIDTLKKDGLLGNFGYNRDDVAKFAKYYDYPSMREWYEEGDEEVADMFNEFIENDIYADVSLNDYDDDDF